MLLEDDPQGSSGATEMHSRSNSEKVKQREASGSYYRMPICFGPFPGPRQTHEGKSRLHTKDWKEATRRVFDITFKTPKAYAESLLPHECFTIDVPGDDVYCNWSLRELGNLGWLGGNSYRTMGLSIADVVCRGPTETVRGDFQVLIYENMSDPITSGRDELGTSKIYCTLEDDVSDTEYVLKAGWGGHDFCTVKATGLKDIDVGTAKAKKSYKPSEGVLHYKYIPATGRPGYADVEYPCFVPYSPSLITDQVTNKAQETMDVSFDWQIGDERKLPTLHHIVAGLSKFEVLEIVNARVTWLTRSGDLSNIRAVR